MSDTIIRALQVRLHALIEADRQTEGSPFRDVWKGPRSTQVSFAAFGETGSFIIHLDPERAAHGKQDR